MRDRGTYYVVREAHKVESDQQVRHHRRLDGIETFALTI